MGARDMMNCNHDHTNAIRKGRAHYVCPVCDTDITLELVLLEEMKRKSEAIEQTGEGCVVNKLMD